MNRLATLAAVSLLAVSALAQAPTPAPAPAPAAQRSLEVKYVRDSAEYATLTRQVYRMARVAVAASAPKSGPWGVVLDVDETVLDNSTYQLDRNSYGVPFDSASWAWWVERRQAGAVPGVKELLDDVRKAGGHVVFLTDRDAQTTVDGRTLDGTAATRDNLQTLHLWSSDDLLCLKKGDSKGERRKALATGSGDCSWKGAPLQVVAFVGDQMGDFPNSGEPFPGAGRDDEFGRSFFLLPNPMYSSPSAGLWTNNVTRESRSFH